MNPAASLFLAVVLAWDPPPDPSVTGYRVWWGTVSGLHGDSSDAGPATTKTLSDDIFWPEVTYYFVARSYNAAGIESSDSNEVSGPDRRSDADPDARANPKPAAKSALHSGRP